MDDIEKLDYGCIYNSSYYRMFYPETAKRFGATEESLLRYFVKYGTRLGHQGSKDFNVYSYRRWNQDLALGEELRDYYIHYVKYGKHEKRVAIGLPEVKQLTVYQGIDYQDVYKFEEYVTYNEDVWQLYGFQPERVLRHFVERGMDEGRKAYSQFDIRAYRAYNPDVAREFGDRWKEYYLHYIERGKEEQRRAVYEVS